MTALQLYKFIEESSSDFSFDDGKAIIWVYHCWINDFSKIIGNYYLNEGLEVILQHSCIAVDMTDILEENDIDPSTLLKPQTP